MRIATFYTLVGKVFQGFMVKVRKLFYKIKWQYKVNNRAGNAETSRAIKKIFRNR
jgi:hypothetical protein